LFLVGVMLLFMHVWIGFSSCISHDVFDLVSIDVLELFLEFFLLFELFLVFVFFIVVFFIFILIFDVTGIIIIHSCNPISIMVDDAVSVLELKAFETLLICHVFDSFDDDIGHWYLVDNVH
jgi:hypothetical protein